MLKAWMELSEDSSCPGMLEILYVPSISASGDPTFDEQSDHSGLSTFRSTKENKKRVVEHELHHIICVRQRRTMLVGQGSRCIMLIFRRYLSFF